MPMRSELAVLPREIDRPWNRSMRGTAREFRSESSNELWNKPRSGINADGSVAAIVLFVAIGLILSIGAMLVLPISDEIAGALALLS